VRGTWPVTAPPATTTAVGREAAAHVVERLLAHVDTEFTDRGAAECAHISRPSTRAAAVLQLANAPHHVGRDRHHLARVVGTDLGRALRMRCDPYSRRGRRCRASPVCRMPQRVPTSGHVAVELRDRVCS